MPLDLLSLVFAKLGAIEVLMGAGLVCHSWLQAGKMPDLWRSVNMVRHEVLLKNSIDVSCSMAKVAVDRSDGQLEAFMGEGFITDDLLKYIGDRSPALKSLHIILCNILFNEGFIKAIKKFPLLEKLEISLCENIYGKTVEAIGKACPHLKSFRLNNDRFYYTEDDYTNDEEARGISTMRELRYLQLFGNRLTNKGLGDILDNCRHLEFLDVRHCFNVDTHVDAALQAKCARIETVRLPDGLTDDYDYQVNSPIWNSPNPYSREEDSREGFDYYDLFIDEIEDYGFGHEFEDDGFDPDIYWRHLYEDIKDDWMF